MGWLAFYSTYYSTHSFSHHWLSGVLSAPGSEILAWLVMNLVFYIYCRQKVRDEADTFFGFSATSKSSALSWLVLFMTWQTLILLAKKYVLESPNTESFAEWPIAYFIVPFCLEIVFRGFILNALKLHFKTLPALLLSSALCSLAYHSDFSLAPLFFTFGSSLLLGTARLNSRSIYPSLLMASIGRLVPAILISWVIGN